MKILEHKPTIETIVNTTALTLTAAGTNFVLNHDYWGFLCIIAGAALEFFKYWGRKRKLW